MMSAISDSMPALLEVVIKLALLLVYWDDLGIRLESLDLRARRLFSSIFTVICLELSDRKEVEWPLELPSSLVLTKLGFSGFLQQVV